MRELLTVAEAASSGNPLIDWIVQAGPVGILVVIAFLFIRGDIVSRKTLEDAVAQRDRALDLIYEQNTVTRRAVDVSLARLQVDEKLADLRQKGVNP